MDAVAKKFMDECRPKLEMLEKIRLRKLRTFQFRKKLAIPIGAVATPILGFIDYWLMLLQRGNDDTVFGITILFMAGLWAWVTHPKRQYAREYKTKILPGLAGLFGNFTYDLKGKIPVEAMKPSKILPAHTGYKSEDFFSGVYKKVKISFSEIKLTKKSGKNTKTVFKGLAILLSHGTRKFHGHTILTKDQGKIGAWLTKQTDKLERADLVDTEFEKTFDVFTNDQVEARYLIDPLIIEELKGLYKEYDGNKMMVAFYDDHILILIGSSANHFEPAEIHTPAFNEQAVMSLKREIEQVLSLVDRLSLYDPRRVHDDQAAVA